MQPKYIPCIAQGRGRNHHSFSPTADIVILIWILRKPCSLERIPGLNKQRLALWRVGHKPLWGVKFWRTHGWCWRCCTASLSGRGAGKGGLKVDKGQNLIIWIYLGLTYIETWIGWTTNIMIESKHPFRGWGRSPCVATIQCIPFGVRSKGLSNSGYNFRDVDKRVAERTANTIRYIGLVVPLGVRGGSCRGYTWHC